MRSDFRDFYLSQKDYREDLLKEVMVMRELNQSEPCRQGREGTSQIKRMAAGYQKEANIVPAEE